MKKKKKISHKISLYKEAKNYSHETTEFYTIMQLGPWTKNCSWYHLVENYFVFVQ